MVLDTFLSLKILMSIYEKQDNAGLCKLYYNLSSTSFTRNLLHSFIVFLSSVISFDKRIDLTSKIINTTTSGTRIERIKNIKRGLAITCFIECIVLVFTLLIF